MKYTYIVNLNKMEKTYFSHTNIDFFSNDEERKKFKAKLIVEADSEEEATKIRMGITDILMWDLLFIED